MKGSIKKQSLPDLTGINARFHESLSFYVFRTVRKGQLSPPRQTFIVQLDNTIHTLAAHTNFSCDSSLAVTVMVPMQYPFTVTN